MTAQNEVFVSVETFQGNVTEVRVFTSGRKVLEVEQDFIRRYKIENEDEREGQAQNGNEFTIHHCEVE